MRLYQFMFSPEMQESTCFLTDILIYIYVSFVSHFPWRGEYLWLISLWGLSLLYLMIGSSIFIKLKIFGILKFPNFIYFILNFDLEIFFSKISPSQNTLSYGWEIFQERNERVESTL